MCPMATPVAATSQQPRRADVSLGPYHPEKVGILAKTHLYVYLNELFLCVSCMGTAAGFSWREYLWLHGRLRRGSFGSATQLVG